MQRVSVETLLLMLGFVDSGMSKEQFMNPPKERSFCIRTRKRLVDEPGVLNMNVLFTERYPCNCIAQPSLFNFLRRYLRFDVENVTELTVCEIPFQGFRQFASSTACLYGHWQHPQLNKLSASISTTL